MPLPAQLCLVSEFVTPREAAHAFGVSLKTLRVWDSKGKIRSTRTPGGHRRYDVESVEGWRELVRHSAQEWAREQLPEPVGPGKVRRRSAPTEAGRQDDDGEAG